MSQTVPAPLGLKVASYIGRLRMDGSRLTKGKLQNFKTRLTQPVEQTVAYDNIYYCCTQKTASQWFKGVFRDRDFYSRSGLVVSPYQYLGLNYARISSFPKQTVVSHLYFNYQDYLKIPKPPSYKTFFVLRDPRDIIVSWYFSARYSHVLVPPIHTMRHNLARLDFQDGLRYLIDTQAEFGLFDCQRSWVEAQKNYSEIGIFRYEDLARDEVSFVRDLFDFLELDLPETELQALVNRHTISKRSQDRSSLNGDLNNHYRKGVSGDWQHHFSDRIADYFNQITGDLLSVLAY